MIHCGNYLISSQLVPIAPHAAHQIVETVVNLVHVGVISEPVTNHSRQQEVRLGSKVTARLRNHTVVRYIVWVIQIPGPAFVQLPDVIISEICSRESATNIHDVHRVPALSPVFHNFFGHFYRVLKVLGTLVAAAAVKVHSLQVNSQFLYSEKLVFDVILSALIDQITELIPEIGVGPFSPVLDRVFDAGQPPENV